MLEEQLDFLLDSLRDLDRELAAGDIGPDDHAALRADYTSRAAAIARQLQGSEIDVPDHTPPLRRPRWHAAMAVLVVLALATGSGWFVAASSGQRLPGQSSSGGIEESTATRLASARQLNFSDPGNAIELYSEVLKSNPDNVEALTYRAWIVALTARNATGTVRDAAYATVLADLLKARRIDPTYPDAACFLGITYFRFLDDALSAKPQIDECRENNPPQEVQQFVQGIADQVDAAVSGN
jgi:tetratricopeptide (TPR) repeat protein